MSEFADLTCPECGAVAGRIVGHEVQGVYDGVLWWSCRDCGRLWNRWPVGDSRHAKAQTYIDNMMRALEGERG